MSQNLFSSSLRVRVCVCVCGGGGGGGRYLFCMCGSRLGILCFAVLLFP